MDTTHSEHEALRNDEIVTNRRQFDAHALDRDVDPSREAARSERIDTAGATMQMPEIAGRVRLLSGAQVTQAVP